MMRLFYVGLRMLVYLNNNVYLNNVCIKVDTFPIHVQKFMYGPKLQYVHSIFDNQIYYMFIHTLVTLNTATWLYVRILLAKVSPYRNIVSQIAFSKISCHSNIIVNG